MADPSNDMGKRKIIEEKDPVPEWYLVTEGQRIIGGLGVIENDVHDRKDIPPASMESLRAELRLP